jgi:hypothetical protein
MKKIASCSEEIKIRTEINKIEDRKTTERKTNLTER